MPRPEIPHRSERPEGEVGPANGHSLLAGPASLAKGALAFLICLVLVGLPNARAYSDPGWAPVLAGGTVALALVMWWLARGQGPLRVSVTEVVSLGLAGLLLTVLFWTRAELGVPRVMLGDLPLKLTSHFGGWAWPALLLMVLYRRAGEGVRAGGGRRMGLLLAAGVVAGSVGFALHPIALDRVRANDSLQRTLERPVLSPAAMALTGGPYGLAAEPTGVTFHLDGAGEPRSRGVSVSGASLPGLRGDLSTVHSGTRLSSSDPSVADAESDEGGGWALRPVAAGNAVVTVRNRGARAWIGVWVLEAGQPPEPPEDVTGSVEVEAGAVRPPAPGEGFAYRQTFLLRNVSGEPVLGPLHLVLRVPAGAPGTVGAGVTAHPAVLAAFGDSGEESEQRSRFASVEALPGRDRLRVPGTVLAPHEAVTVELLVTDRIQPGQEGVEARVFRSRRAF